MRNAADWSRRRLIQTGLAAGVACLATQGPAALAANEPVSGKDAPWRGLKLGVASYTLRKLPLEGAIKAIQRVGLHYVSIKDFHLPLSSTPEQRRETTSKFRAAGIEPLSCGVITIQNNEQQARRAFEYARDAGIPTIVCSPHPQSLGILDGLVKEFNIRLAIHNHGPDNSFFRSPRDAWEAIQNRDERIGLCVDVGHTARLGEDPAEAILKFQQRVYDVHIKDIDRKDAKGGCIEGGRGVLDLKAILAALLKIRFTGLVGIEYEKDGDDPIPGLAETIGYLRGLLQGIDMK